MQDSQASPVDIHHHHILPNHTRTRPPSGRPVPTVYATLDTRHARAHAHVLRHAHSQASLENVTQETGLPDTGGGGGGGHEVTCVHHPSSRSFSHDINGGDLAQPLLSEESMTETELVDKRESSV